MPPRRNAASEPGGPRSAAKLSPRPIVPGPREPGRYSELSTRPLHILVFLLPLLAFYEIGSAVYLVDPENGVVETIRARSILSGFFQAFDAVGLFLPGIALVTVLLVWHVLNKDRWTLRPAVLAGMGVESALWTIPLLVMSVLVHQMVLGSGPPPAAQGTPDILSLPWQARLTISIGAGLYEELLFRMIAIAALHLVFVDLARLSEGVGRMFAVGLSAAAFAVYHDLSSSGGDLDPARVLFFLCAGVYFGTIYLWRGFGIVVAVHALYDVLVLVLLRPPG